MKNFFKILVILLLTQFSIAAVADQSLPNFAVAIKDEVAKKFKSCGLKIVDANDSSLHGLQLSDASYAAVNSTGRVLAYFIQSYEGNPYWRWVSPDLSREFSLLFTTTYLRLQTPYEGQMAYANRYYVGNNLAFNFHCKSTGQLANFSQFEQCVVSDFVNVLANAVCK